MTVGSESTESWTRRPSARTRLCFREEGTISLSLSLSLTHTHTHTGKHYRPRLIWLTPIRISLTHTHNTHTHLTVYSLLSWPLLLQQQTARQAYYWYRQTATPSRGGEWSQATRSALRGALWAQANRACSPPPPSTHGHSAMACGWWHIPIHTPHTQHITHTLLARAQNSWSRNRTFLVLCRTWSSVKRTCDTYAICCPSLLRFGS